MKALGSALTNKNEKNKNMKEINFTSSLETQAQQLLKGDIQTHDHLMLPDNLHSILVGIMLGDGSLYRSSKTSNTRFEMSRLRRLVKVINNLLKV